MPCDICELHEKIYDFIFSCLLEFSGSKNITIIFAGRTYDGSLQTIDFERLNGILGDSAGKIDDPFIAEGLKFIIQSGGFEQWKNRIPLFLPRRQIFQFKIKEDKMIFGVKPSLDGLNLITDGTRTLSEEEGNTFLKFFLDKKDLKKDAESIINFMRNQFSDSIGGGVMLGVLEEQSPGVTLFTYDVKRNPIKPSSTDWSFSIEGENRLIITDPFGKKIELNKSLFEESLSSKANLEL